MKRLIISGLIILVLLIYYFFFSSYVTLNMVKKYLHAIRLFVKDHYMLSVFLYIFSYVFIGTFALPVAQLLSLVGGALFGSWLGTLYVIVGASTGAVFAFLVVRYVAGESLQKRYQAELEDFNKEFEKRGIYYLMSMRFLPLIPFFLVNVLAGLSRVPLRIFVVSTIIGVSPGAFVYAYAGQSLATLESTKDILSTKIIIALALLGLLALLPVVIQKVKAR